MPAGTEETIAGAARWLACLSCFDAARPATGSEGVVGIADLSADGVEAAEKGCAALVEVARGGVEGVVEVLATSDGMGLFLDAALAMVDDALKERRGGSWECCVLPVRRVVRSKQRGQIADAILHQRLIPFYGVED